MATVSLSDGKQACAHFADEKTEAAAAVLLLTSETGLVACDVCSVTAWMFSISFGVAAACR